MSRNMLNSGASRSIIGWPHSCFCSGEASAESTECVSAKSHKAVEGVALIQTHFQRRSGETRNPKAQRPTGWSQPAATSHLLSRCLGDRQVSDGKTGIHCLQFRARKDTGLPL
jgi:hypothetical protein